MTFGDLLDEIAAQAGDESGTGRAQARRWLNLTRSYIADQAQWRSAFTADATFTTAAATTDGLYALSGYSSVSGDYLYDETNLLPIQFESFAALNAIDPDKTTTGQPSYWSDAGMDSNGLRRIFLWPIPDSAYTIRYAAYKDLSDIAAGNETLTLDPYFGPIPPWQSTFLAGLRYYMDLDSNEQPQQIALQKMVFDQQIKQRKRGNTVAPHAGGTLSRKRSVTINPTGRYDPAHYANRG